MVAPYLLERFEGVRGAGDDQWNAKCPAHSDDRASLSIRRTDDRWLLHCHAGCSFEDVRLAVGLEWRDLFDGSDNDFERKRRIVLPSSKGHPVVSKSNQPLMPPESVVETWQRALGLVQNRLHFLKGWTPEAMERLGLGFDGERVVFPVRDVETDRLVSLVRYRPGHNPKTLAVGGRHLWPAPEYFKGDVWLVEGEPDAVSAACLGIDAVAVPGVNTWKVDWAKRFQGLRVTVCFDCDGPGRAARCEVQMRLHGADIECRAVDLNPRRDDGWDLSDALVESTRQGRLKDLHEYLVRLENEAWA